MLFKGVSWKTVTGTFETRLITRRLICDTEARAGASVCLSRWVGIRGRSLLSLVTSKGRKSATGSKPERSHEEGAYPPFPPVGQEVLLLSGLESFQTQTNSF